MSSKPSPRKGCSLEVKGEAASYGGKAMFGESTKSRSSSKTTSPNEADAVDQVMAINRHLLTQIETLRLKLDIDDRHHAQSMATIVGTSDRKLKTRDLEIENLKGDISKKEQLIKNYAQANKEKQGEICRLQEYIEDLKEDVEMSKRHTEEIQGHLDTLKTEKAKLLTGDAYCEKDSEIQKLQSEIDRLKRNLACLEEELSRAKKTISQQRGQLRHAELDRTNDQIRFKDELAKLSVNMRREVEKIRDVMKMQWNEMKELREQNEGMRSDLREIKELLASDIQNSHRSSSSSPVLIRPAPLSLPGLSKENTKMLQNRKKK